MEEAGEEQGGGGGGYKTMAVPVCLRQCVLSVADCGLTVEFWGLGVSTRSGFLIF